MNKKFMILAAAALLTLAACGNKQAATTDEGAAPEATEQNAAPEGEMVENDDYAVVVPSGWTNKTENPKFVILEKEAEPGRYKFLRFYAYPKDNRTAEAWAKQQLGAEINSAEADIEAGGYTWKVICENNATDATKSIYHAVTDMPNGGFFQVSSFNGFNLTDEEIKAVLATITLK